MPEGSDAKSALSQLIGMGLGAVGITGPKLATLIRQGAKAKGLSRTQVLKKLEEAAAEITLRERAKLVRQGLADVVDVAPDEQKIFASQPGSIEELARQAGLIK